MATRFYLPAEGSAAASVSPAFDAGWEVTTGASRLQLLEKLTLSTTSTIANSRTVSTAITTTQDYLHDQYISGPIPPQNITGTVSFVVSVTQTPAPVAPALTLAFIAKVISNDGNTVRGTLLSVFGTDTQYSPSSSFATRIVNAQAVTAVTTQPGDRLLIEVGTHANAPAKASGVIFSLGDNNASDFALTSGLTTTLNPWVEFSQNIWSSDTNNYQFVKVGDGMSVSEKIR